MDLDTPTFTYRIKDMNIFPDMDSKTIAPAISIYGGKDTPALFTWTQGYF